MAQSDVPDYTYKGGDPTQTVIGVYQKQAEIAMQQQQQAQLAQQQRIQQIKDVFTGAAQVTSTLVAASKAKAQTNAQNSVASLLAQSNSQVPVFKPMTPGQQSAVTSEQINPMGANFAPSQALGSTETNAAQAPSGYQTYGSTPEYKSQLRSLALKAFPEEASKALSKQAFPDEEALAAKQQAMEMKQESMRQQEDQRQFMRTIAQQNADARSQNADTNTDRLGATETGKLILATDEKKMPDYSRLEASNRLTGLALSAEGKPNRFQMKESASAMASMLSGGGGAARVAEKLINDLTPDTVQGTAAKKLEYLLNHPENTRQQKFLDSFLKTSRTEARIAEANVRQQQVAALLKSNGTSRRYDPEGWNDVLRGIGLTEANIDFKNGKFLPGHGERSLIMTAEELNPKTSGNTVNVGGKEFTFTVGDK